MIDGEPVFREIEGSRYERVVNSPFLIARGGKDLYLYIGSNAWYPANDIDGHGPGQSRYQRNFQRQQPQRRRR